MREYKLFTEIMRNTKGAINYEDPNKRIIYSVGCLVWNWRQEYIKERTSHYIPSKTYNSLLERLTEYEGKIVTGSYRKEAEDQINNSKKWVELALAHRVRLPQGKNRVY